MPMILKIALRNLGEHKIKSIIICGLVAVGMLMLVLSGSVLETAMIGIEKSFVQSFSGHILVGPKTAKGELPSLFPGSGFNIDMASPPTVPEYPRVFAKLQEWPGVAVANPQVFGMMQMSLADTWGAGGGAFAFNSELYKQMFPENITIDEGRELVDGEEGLLLPKMLWTQFREAAVKDFLPALKERHADLLKDKSDAQIKTMALAGEIPLLDSEQELIEKATIKVGDKIKLLGFGRSMKIKSVPVVGIFHYNVSNAAIEDFSLLDLSSSRYLMGMVVGSTSQMNIDANATDKLDSESDDDFFGDGVVSTEDASTNTSVDYSNPDAGLGSMEEAAALNKPDDGAWHYVLLRLQDSKAIESTIKSLNDWFAAENLNLVAVNWEQAAGQMVTTVRAFQTVIYIAIGFIVFICLLIITNTMVASIIERTSEIGTMRALGAQKDFVRQVFLSETFVLSGVGGLIGMLVALILLWIMNVVGVPIGDQIFQMIFGTALLRPIVSLPIVAAALASILGVGLLSSLYPIFLAMRVSPLKAMQS